MPRLLCFKSASCRSLSCSAEATMCEWCCISVRGQFTCERDDECRKHGCWIARDGGNHGENTRLFFLTDEPHVRSRESGKSNKEAHPPTRIVRQGRKNWQPAFGRSPVCFASFRPPSCRNWHFIAEQRRGTCPEGFYTAAIKTRDVLSFFYRRVVKETRLYPIHTSLGV